MLPFSHSGFRNLLIIIIISFFIQINTYVSPTSCTGTNLYYNIFSHQCQICPNNNTVQATDNTYCNCSTIQTYKNPNGIGFMHSSSCIIQWSQTLGSNDIALIYDRAGTLQNPVLKKTCDTSAHPNIDKTACIPCGINMVYNSTGKICECATNFYPVGGYCMDGSSLTNPITSPTLAQDKLLYGVAYFGCTSGNPSKESCQILLNKCAQSGYQSSNSFCSLLAAKSAIISGYQSTSQDLNISLGIYASSVAGANTTTVKNTLNFVVFEYDKFGQLKDIKPFDKDLLPCLLTEADVIKFQSFGLNLIKTCSQTQIKSSQDPSFYDIYVQNSQSNYVQVFTTYSSTSFYKRYYLSDWNSASMQFISAPPLVAPYITLKTGSTPLITTSSKSNQTNLVLLAPFIIFNIGIAIVFVANFYKYMKYNPDENNDPYFCFKIFFIFILMAIKHWGIGLWIWLLGVSTYCFCFYKFQQTIYLILPDISTQWYPYYDQFMIIYYLQFGFVLFSIGLLIYDLGTTTDYFFIDWEKEKNESNYNINMGNNKKQISVWRKVLLVNELYQLTISEAINISLTILFGIFFLDGLSWINLSYQIPNISNIQSDSTSTQNNVLAYFIITFIFFIIAIIQYILRYLVKTWNPLPHEDFIDLCCLSNISLVIFDHPLHGYYIHGMNPLGKAEGSLAYIESIFQKQAKSFGKSRAFRNDDPDQVQTYEVIFPQQIRNAFQMKYKNRYLQRLIGRAMDTSLFAKPIPDMLDENDYKELENIQNDMLDSFKYYLQGVKTSQFNIRERPFLQRLTQWPMDMDYLKGLPIFFKDYWHEFTEVLLSGHEIIFLINLINFINIFYLATKSVTVACLITLIICKLVIKNFSSFLLKRNIARNSLIDDKFFN